MMQRREMLKALLTLAAGTGTAAVTRSANAKPGRPASPTSVAGVRRRTRRRTRRRIYRNQRLYSLPYGCSVTRRRAGSLYYYCGGVWYRPMYHGTTVVYVVDSIDAGAETNVEFEE